MAETTGNEDLAATVRDRGMEQLEGAKGQLAEGAERVAAAVERTADEIGGDEDNAISGFGHSVASLMRQLAGGLRERDIEEFAHELAALARRNPGVFLAGSVALGFGIARFFKARAPQSRSDGDWQSGGWGTRQSARGARQFDDEESLDMSASAAERRKSSLETSGSQRESASQESKSSYGGTSSKSSSAPHDDEQDASTSKSRQSTKSKAKPQRASSGGAQSQSASTESPSTDSAAASGTTESKDSAFTSGTGGSTLRGGKS